MFGGCYSDPNIAPEKRVQLDDFPPADGRPNTGGLLANASPTPPGQLTAPAPGEAGGKIAIGDSLTISFSDVPRESGLPQQLIVKVGSDGTFTLPYNKIIHALGRTPTELEREIHSTYVPSLFVNCTAVVKPEERYFFVGGEVRVSSRQIFTSHSMTVLRAITTAGGFTDFANKSKIELRRANGGKTEYINYKKALKDPKLDLPVYPNDQIIVPRGL
jgi:polysaccharide export outer membrane protein